MALDADGTIGAFVNGLNGSITQLTLAQMQALNDENMTTSYPWTTATTYGSNPHYLAMIFPENRDIAGVFVHTGGADATMMNQATPAIEVSTNTTNGVDGTWTVLTSDYTLIKHAGSSALSWRTGIPALSASGVKAVRYKAYRTIANGTSMTMIAFHLYGSPSAGQNTRKFALWHPTLDQKLGANHLDWGDASRNSGETRMFRVKNLTPDMKATGFQFSYEALTDATPTQVGQHSLSLDGSTYSSTVSIGELAPGAISPVIYARRVTASTAALGVWALRLKASATGWALSG
jgi:hypothetical protein